MTLAAKVCPHGHAALYTTSSVFLLWCSECKRTYRPPDCPPAVQRDVFASATTEDHAEDEDE